MRRGFTSLVLFAGLISLVGCGLTGESTQDAMKRIAKARAAANKEQAERQKQKAATAPKATVPTASVAKAGKLPPSKAVKTNSVAAKAKGTNTKVSPVKGGTPKGTGSEPSVTRPPLPIKPERPLTDIQRRNKSAENLEKIIEALNKHAKEKGTYPTQSIVSRGLERPLLSWRVAILPYLGLENFYQEFKLDEAWDSPHNLALLPHIPPVYVSPERYDEKTNYLAPNGPGTAWYGIRGTDPLSFADGADRTLVVLEADDSASVPWTKPEDLTTGPELRSRLGHLRGDGFIATFGNGYVAMIHNKITDGQLSWMLSTDGDDYLTDRTIIFDATVPDVALVTNEPKPSDGIPDPSATSDSNKPGEPAKPAGSSVTSSPDRIRGLPPVVLPQAPKRPVRKAVPPEDDLAKAREQLKSIYYQEYKDSRLKNERRKIAAKMLAEAPRLEEDPAAYYELLRMVRQIAVQTGDYATALKAVELLETNMEIPPLELRLKTLDELAGTIGDGTQGAAQIAAESEKVLISAYEGDDFPTALEAHRIHMAMLRKSSDRERIGRVGAYRQAILEAEKMYKQVPAALSALATNLENTEANEVAGKYFCLVKEQWDVGLPMMARGTDLKLRLLARIDLEKGKTGPELVQLADHYWDLAQEFKHPQRRSLELRAAFHYAAAMPLLTDGINLVKSEKRLAEVNRMYGRDALVKSGGGSAILPTTIANPKDDSG